MTTFKTGDIVVHKWDDSPFTRGKVMAVSAAGKVFVRWFDGHKSVSLENEENLLPLAEAQRREKERWI